MQTYLFSDYATSGPSVAFDQVIRFVAIRTDRAFQILEEHDVSVHLRADIIPDPTTVLRRGWSIEGLCSEGAAEVEAMRTVHRLIHVPGTTSIYYRAYGAEDEVLSFAFYRNLLDPITPQAANDCGTLRLYPLVVMQRLLEGEPRQIVRGEASATSDVAGGARAALAVARQLAADAARWKELRGYFDSATDRARMEVLPTFRIGDAERAVALMIDPAFGAAQHFQRPVIRLGTHRYDASESCWLALDTPALQDVATGPVRPVAEVMRKTLGQPGFLRSWRDERVNRLDEDRRAIVRQNLAWLRAYPALFEQIAGYYLEATDSPPAGVDADAARYDVGRLTEDERALAERFHASETAVAKAALIPKFERTVVQTLALRVLMRNMPESTWPDVVRRYAEAYRRRVHPRTRSDVLIDHRGRPRRTPAEVIRMIERMREEGWKGGPLDTAQRERLDALDRYARRTFRIRRASSSLPG